MVFISVEEFLGRYYWKPEFWAIFGALKRGFRALGEEILEFNEDDLQNFWKKISILTRAMVNNGEKASSLK